MEENSWEWQTGAVADTYDSYTSISQVLIDSRALISEMPLI